MVANIRPLPAELRDIPAAAAAAAAAVVAGAGAGAETGAGAGTGEGAARPVVQLHVKVWRCRLKPADPPRVESALAS